MSGLTCPECGNPLTVNQEWVITDPSLIGTKATGSLQGDYKHEACP